MEQMCKSMISIPAGRKKVRRSKATIQFTCSVAPEAINSAASWSWNLECLLDLPLPDGVVEGVLAVLLGVTAGVQLLGAGDVMGGGESGTATTVGLILTAPSMGGS